MRDGVIVIPNHTGTLEVGVKIVFVMSRLYEVVRPAVKGRTLLAR